MPGNLDAWRDLAFAVRHLGMRSECDAFLFHSDLVASFDEDHELNSEVFRRLGVSEPEGSTADLSMPQLLLLRWVGEATR